MADQEHDADDELQHEAPWRIDGPTPGQEIYEAFPEQPAAYGVNPDDGLPQPVVPASIKLAMGAPLLRETFVCMEDTRAFVIRGGRGEVLHQVDPQHVQLYPDGRYRAQAENVPPAAYMYRDAANLVEVEPERPVCSHYARQLIDFPDDPDYLFVVRLCTARRTDSGEFLSLRDMKMHACELRNPRLHLIDAERLTAADARRVQQAEQKRRREVDFDPSAPWAPTTLPPAGRRPIFDDSPLDDS